MSTGYFDVIYILHVMNILYVCSPNTLKFLFCPLSCSSINISTWLGKSCLSHYYKIKGKDIHECFQCCCCWCASYCSSLSQPSILPSSLRAIACFICGHQTNASVSAPVSNRIQSCLVSDDVFP